MKNILYVDTPSAKSLSIEVDIDTIKVDSITAFEDYNKFSNLCKDGCPNYQQKWSCPPYSPKFTEYSNGFIYITICAMTMHLGQLLYIKNDYLKVKAANSILKSKADKILGSFVTEHTKYISTGSCRLCKPCKCKKGESCAHSSKMAYSFEALGIDVNKITESLFDFELLWHKKGNCPLYTSVVVGLLTIEKPNKENILRTLQNVY